MQQQNFWGPWAPGTGGGGSDYLAGGLFDMGGRGSSGLSSGGTSTWPGGGGAGTAGPWYGSTVGGSSGGGGGYPTNSPTPGGAWSPFGSGSNQYGSYPTMSNLNLSILGPQTTGTPYSGGYGGGGTTPIGGMPPYGEGPGGSGGGGTAPGTVPYQPPYGGYPGFGTAPPGASYPPGNLANVPGSVGAPNVGSHGEVSQASTDPQFTKAMDDWMRSQLGAGLSPFNLQSYLPSTGGSTGAGQIAAPLNPQLQQLQNSLMTGMYGAPSQQMMQQLMQTGGLTGILGNLYQTGGQTGALGNIGQTGGLTGPLGNLYRTGGLTGPLGQLYQGGGLTQPMSQIAGTSGGLVPGTTLSNIASGATGIGPQGSIDQTPAWQAMLASEQQNIAQNAAQLKEQFASTGNLASSPYANAMSQYYQQTALGQNASLTQAQAQALEAAAQRQLSASGTNLGAQLSAGQTGLGAQTGVGEYGIGTQAGLGQFGVGTQAGIGQGGIQSQLQSLLPSMQMQQNLGLAGVGTQGGMAQDLTQMGGQLGQYTQGLDQASINTLMQEYFATLPQTNPLEQQMYSFANAYPPGYMSGQGTIGAGLLGAAGPILGGVGDIIKSIPWGG